MTWSAYFLFLFLESWTNPLTIELWSMFHLWSLFWLSILCWFKITFVQICLQAASAVAKSWGKIVFLDSGNSFSPKRVSQIITQTSDLSAYEVKAFLAFWINLISLYMLSLSKLWKKQICRSFHSLTFLTKFCYLLLEKMDCYSICSFSNLYVIGTSKYSMKVRV